MRWQGHVAGKGNKAHYEVLAGIPDGKRSFQRSTPKWEDNIKMEDWRVWTGVIWLVGTNGELL